MLTDSRCYGFEPPISELALENKTLQDHEAPATNGAQNIPSEKPPKMERHPNGNDRTPLDRNLDMKTLGGGQFWGDVFFFHDWRIQQNVFTKHFRLLDGKDFRHAWGTFDECKARLELIKKERKLLPMKGRGTILIHGILRTSKCMESMAIALKKEGYETFLFDYPSTQVSIPDAAGFLHKTIESLDGIEELNIVCHSMGGLVTRAYFEKHYDKRLQKVVMLGTPNKGAELADFVYKSSLVRTIAGPGGRQLITANDGLLRKLPAPRCTFAVIAGARNNPSGWNPIIPGDDDGTVTVESTKLSGACDFATVNVTHGGLLRSPEPIEMALRFLNMGRLIEDRAPVPILEDHSDFVDQSKP